MFYLSPSNIIKIGLGLECNTHAHTHTYRKVNFTNALLMSICCYESRDKQWKIKQGRKKHLIHFLCVSIEQFDSKISNHAVTERNIGLSNALSFFLYFILMCVCVCLQYFEAGYLLGTYIFHWSFIDTFWKKRFWLKGGSLYRGLIFNIVVWKYSWQKLFEKIWVMCKLLQKQKTQKKIPRSNQTHTLCVKHPLYGWKLQAMLQSWM